MKKATFYQCPVHENCISNFRGICAIKKCGLSMMTQKEMRVKALVREGHSLKDAKRYVKEWEI